MPNLLLCALHSERPPQDYCPDYAHDPTRHQDPLEQWEPFGASYEGDELEIDAVNRALSRQHLLGWHPCFTGRCPQCGDAISDRDEPHWDCPCGWVDDSV
jgi:hypothetical protein